MLCPSYLLWLGWNKCNLLSYLCDWLSALFNLNNAVAEEQNVTSHTPLAEFELIAQLRQYKV